MGKFDKLLVRSSSTHRMMTHIEKSGMQKGHITFAEELESELHFGLKPTFTVDTIEKGIIGEAEARNLFNRVLNARGKEKYHFKQNYERLYNEWSTGLPDTFIGKNIRSTTHGFDTKCSKNVSTFPRHEKELDKNYYWQNQSYMDLTGADLWTTVYALVNSPVFQIVREQETVYYKLGSPDESQEIYPRYLEKMIEIEKNSIFDIDLFRKQNPNHDLFCEDWDHLRPIEDRVKEFTVERNDYDIAKIHERVEMIRDHMNSNF